VPASDQLTLTATGSLTDVSGSAIVIGNATLNAANITLGDAEDDTVQFSTLNLTSGLVNITETGSMRLGNVAADTLTLATRGGDITETADAIVTVANDTFLDSGVNNITLNRSNNSFGDLTVVGATVILNESDASNLLSIDSSLNFSLESEGNITALGVLSIGGAASFASPENITLNNALNTFGSLNLSGQEISVVESNSTQLDNVNATMLTLSSARDITDATDATLIVTGSVNLQTPTGNITLGQDADDQLRFGDLTVTAQSLVMNESDSTLFGDIRLSDLTVESGGDISQLSATSVQVSNDSELTVQPGRDVLLTATENIFGEISVAGNQVVITEGDADGLELDQITAEVLTVTTAGNITQSSSAETSVTGLATFTTGGGADIALSGANQFGSVTLDGLAVTLNEIDNITIASITADTLVANASGNITELSSAVITVANTATLVAGGGNNNIQLDNGSNTFGELVLNADEATLVEADSSLLKQVSVNNLDLTSAGDIADTLQIQQGQSC